MRAARAATVVALGAVLYRWLVRERLLNWGATEAEVHAGLPGDELLDDADGVATRAITIDAPPSAVWPWIAQMGPGPRGGAYTYDWIENRFGLNMHSADRVLPEFQHPAPGDTIGVGKTHAHRAGRAGTGACDPLRQRQLGLDVRAPGA